MLEHHPPRNACHLHYSESRFVVQVQRRCGQRARHGRYVGNVALCELTIQQLMPVNIAAAGEDFPIEFIIVPVKNGLVLI